MKFTETNIEGCLIADIEPRGDERGFFARAWCQSELADVGAADHVAQINMSRSGSAGTIRGLHWQEAPYEEAKFMRCIAGRIFDVCVDTRPGSASYLAWFGVELTPGNHRALVIPEGCAHGYQALEDDSEVLYLASAPYAPGVERGLRWDDPAIGIAWPLTENVSVSDKDAAWSNL